MCVCIVVTARKAHLRPFRSSSNCDNIHEAMCHPPRPSIIGGVVGVLNRGFKDIELAQLPGRPLIGFIRFPASGLEPLFIPTRTGKKEKKKRGENKGGRE
jgi:hypothetical protein